MKKIVAILVFTFLAIPAWAQSQVFVGTDHRGKKCEIEYIRNGSEDVIVRNVLSSHLDFQTARRSIDVLLFLEKKEKEYSFVSTEDGGLKELLTQTSFLSDADKLKIRNCMFKTNDSGEYFESYSRQCFEPRLTIAQSIIGDGLERLTVLFLGETDEILGFFYTRNSYFGLFSPSFCTR